MTEKSAFQVQIENMDRKLDEHGDNLKNIQKTLETIAVQSVQITHINSIQTEHHLVIEQMRDHLNLMRNWQGGCPRNSVNKLWAMFWGMVVVFIGAFITHVVKP